MRSARVFPSHHLSFYVLENLGPDTRSGPREYAGRLCRLRQEVALGVENKSLIWRISLSPDGNMQHGQIKKCEKNLIQGLFAEV